MGRQHGRIEAGFALAAALAVGAPALAEVSQPVLLADIGSAPNAAQPSSSLGGTHFVTFAGAAFFDGWDGARGRELWRSDGTPGGTVPVRDICPGSCDGRGSVELVASGGALYFQADDGAHGRELWTSDGTAAGTRMVKDVRPGLRSSSPGFLTAAPGGVYFTADDGTHGVELWFSDGTTVGTHLVADVLPGNPAPNYGAGMDTGGPADLVMVGEVLLFSACDCAHGRELWRTDGTAAGTTLVKDLVPGVEEGFYFYQPWPFAQENPVVAGGRMFFGGKLDDGTSGVVPWVSDGTTAGTMPLLPPPGTAWSTRSFFVFGDDVLFGAGPVGELTLWRSDGTPGGTAPLGTAANGGERLTPLSYARLGDLVFFSGYQTSAGRELWATDGTVAGTERVTEIVAGATGGLDQSWFGFAAAGGRVFFPADDGSHGIELWSSDGTAAGTAMVSDLASGNAAAFTIHTSTYPAALGQQLFFRAWDGTHWGIRALDLQTGALQLLHANTEPAGSIPYCSLRTCASTAATEDGFAFFASDSAHGVEPWSTDGTAGGTHLLADLDAGPRSSLSGFTPVPLVPLPGKLLVVGRPANYVAQLWSFDGAGAIQLTYDTSIVGVTEVAAWSDAGFFSTGDEDVASGGGLWRTDGTVAGTVELLPGITAGMFTPATDSLFFLGSASQLWVTDGTAAQTHLVTTSTYVQVRLMAAAKEGAGGDRVYLVARAAGTGFELWVSDGTDAGTQLVVDLRAGEGDAVPLDAGNWPYDQSVLVALGSRAVFVADDGNGAGEELWVSDGSPGNATLLDVRPGAAGSEPRALTVLGDRVYFVADDGVHGRELWVTDGSVAGTHLVADVWPGPESSTPTDLEPWKEQLVFAAADGVHGMEPWQTVDGEGGAELVVDLRPGVAPSSPQGLTNNGDALMFFADDGATGIEPWAIFVRRPLIVDSFEGGDLDKWSTRTPPP